MEGHAGFVMDEATKMESDGGSRILVLSSRAEVIFGRGDHRN